MLLLIYDSFVTLFTHLRRVIACELKKKLKKTVIPNVTYALDLKMINITLGLNAHSSCHPCAWCDVEKGKLSCRGQLRTLRTISESFWSWHREGADPKLARNYSNCVHLLIIKDDDENAIVNFIPPPELHLMMGAVNSIYDHMLKEWSEAAKWPDSCHLIRSTIPGGTFDGNSCRKLKNVDLLRLICPVHILKYVHVLSDLRKVVDSCFGSRLTPEYVQNIHNFQTSSLSLEKMNWPVFCLLV